MRPLQGWLFLWKLHMPLGKECTSMSRGRGLHRWGRVWGVTGAQLARYAGGCWLGPWEKLTAPTAALGQPDLAPDWPAVQQMAWMGGHGSSFWLHFTPSSWYWPSSSLSWIPVIAVPRHCLTPFNPFTKWARATLLPPFASAYNPSVAFGFRTKGKLLTAACSKPTSCHCHTLLQPTAVFWSLINTKNSPISRTCCSLCREYFSLNHPILILILQVSN